MRDSELSRRAFLVAGATALGGLALEMRTRRLGREMAEEAGAFLPNPFLRIEPSGEIVIVAPRPEMGQGVRTALAMLVAEELDADWVQVRVEQADLDESRYGPQYTGGSAVVRTSWDRLRHAGAAAREMLVAAAATRWAASPRTCRTERSAVVHDPSGRRTVYSDLLAEARTMAVPAEPRLKPASAYVLIGTPRRSLDAPDVVHGRATFGIDVRVPGMLVAVVERCPILGGRAARVDDAAARRSPGVVAVVPIDADALPDFGENSPKMPNGIAVVARSTWQALQGRAALRLTWDGRGGETESTDAMRRAAVRAAARPPAYVERNDGDAERAISSAEHRIEAVYEVPLLAHATMEPMNCTADVRPDRCEIWAPTQNPRGAADVAARITGLAPGAITVHPLRMGGGFGRRFYADVVGETVILSRAVRRPVQVVWTRADDIRHDFYRPAGYHVMRAGLDPQGHIVGWTQHLVNASRDEYLRAHTGDRTPRDPGEVEPYDVPVGFVPNLRIGYTPLESRIPRGQWRAVEPSATVFVTQSFLDELAHAAGRDPLEYQLELVGSPRQMPYYGRTYDTGRLTAVMRLAADRARWGAPLPRGSGRGFAASYANGVYAAHVVEVEVSRGGEVRVRHVVTAADCGRVVNPLGARAQVEGAVIFGLSAALGQRITVHAGRVVQSGFGDYPALRMREAPRHDVHLMPSDAPPSGMGEGALPPIAPALTNAILAATGIRIRSLPVGRLALS